MKVFWSSKAASSRLKSPVLALGNFDGVHLAHRKLLESATSLAKKVNGQSGVYTFDPHPARILSPEKAPPLLLTRRQKIEEIARCGIDALILESFSVEFSHLSPQEFFEKILVDRLRAKGLVVGYDFTFGAKRAGTVEMLKRFCESEGVFLKVLKPLKADGEVISSTRIRYLVREGKVDRAGQLLGKPFEVLGTVIAGEKRGRQLGFPTANLKIENEIIPAFGVYATRCLVGGRWYRSVTNVGVRPTFGEEKLNVEVHLLRFRQSIYGRKVRLEFLEKIRGEKRFNSAEVLRRQIERDVQKAQKFFAAFKKNDPYRFLI